MTFEELVDQELEFLVSGHGFRRGQVADGQVEFVKHPLALRVVWGQGEVAVVFTIDLEFTVDHPVFRPFLTRTFELSEVCRRSGWKPSARSNPGTAANYVVTIERAHAELQRAAALLKKYCRPVLSGDLAVLERITLARQGR